MTFQGHRTANHNDVERTQKLVEQAGFISPAGIIPFGANTPEKHEICWALNCLRTETMNRPRKLAQTIRESVDMSPEAISRRVSGGTRPPANFACN